MERSSDGVIPGDACDSPDDYIKKIPMYEGNVIIKKHSGYMDIQRLDNLRLGTDVVPVIVDLHRKLEQSRYQVKGFHQVAKNLGETLEAVKVDRDFSTKATKRELDNRQNKISKLESDLASLKGTYEKCLEQNKRYAEVNTRLWQDNGQLHSRVLELWKQVDPTARRMAGSPSKKGKLGKLVRIIEVDESEGD